MRRLFPIALLLILPPAMMWPLWSNPVAAGEDDLVAYYPMRKLAGQMLRGEAGTSSPALMLADPQNSLMHPPTWLFAAMPDRAAYSLSIFLAFSVAGWGAYLYLRCLGLVRTAATFGAIVFMFSGFMVGHRVHLTMIWTAAMLPWGLWCIEMARRSFGVRARSPGGGLPCGKDTLPAGDLKGRTSSEPVALPSLAVLLLAVTVGFLSITAGNWPILIYMSIIWVAYLVLRGRPLLKVAGLMAAALILASALASPQIAATVDLMGQATRSKMGFATAGENSFYPPAGIMSLYPMLLGNRTPNFFDRPWWGPWHQCEMLGYVGLITLVLAGAVVWKLYRKPRPAGVGVHGAPCHAAKDRLAASPAGPEGESQTARFRPLVRCWTWISIAAGVWMLGYYLPPVFYVIHKLPVLGMVRCPSRMVLAIQIAAATLSAVAVHLLATNGLDALSKAVRRGAALVLPAVMVATLVIAAAVAYLVSSWHFWEPFSGDQRSAIDALKPSNPAIWVPLSLMLLTLVAVPFILRRSSASEHGTPNARTAGVLVALLLVDLFFVVRFVDMPGGLRPTPDPDISPAAQWLHRNGPDAGTYRVYGMSRGYCERPTELLLPKACQAVGFASIADYGPFQTPTHSQLFGFNVAGYNRDFSSLLRRNYLLSMYGVRYVIAADPCYRELIESIVMPAQSEVIASQPEAASLLGPDWQLNHAHLAGDGGIVFSIPLARSFMSLFQEFASARQAVQLQPEQAYRISLHARAAGGATGFLRAEVSGLFAQQKGMEWDQTGLSIRSEEIGSDWRYFEWSFQAPGDIPNATDFTILTSSDRTVEVRDVRLFPSALDQPIDPHRKLPPGSRVYALRAELPPLIGGDEPVAIYENLLCWPTVEISPGPATAEEVAWLKWDYPKSPTIDILLPDVSLQAPTAHLTAAKFVAVPAAILYAAMLLVQLRRRASGRGS